jgi:hypothetical protein
MAGFFSVEEFFRKKEGQIGAVYDLDEIDVRLISGDGGGRIAGFGERCGCDSAVQFWTEPKLNRCASAAR